MFNRANIESGAAATVEARARDRCIQWSECAISASDNSNRHLPSKDGLNS